MAETAFTRMSRVRALALEEEGRSGATRLARLLERPERTLNSLLLVILVCQLVSANLTGVLLEQNLGTIGFVVGIVVEIAVFFVFFEVVPKTFAIQHTDRAALLVAPILSFLTNFPPLRLLSRGLIGLANVVLPGRGLKEGPFVSEEEIRQMADVAADEEAIERDERKRNPSIFELGDMVVREAMTPRTDMVSISADATIEEGITAAIEGGYSRIPAYEEWTDNIIGLVFPKDLVALARASTRNEPVRTALREAVFVPAQKRGAELLREMQTKQFHMAIVIDEYGGTSGLVTLEDLLEEIVGDIADEYDIEEPSVEHLAGGALRVPGRMSIDDVSDELGIELPDTEWDTISGLILNLLGHVPEDGEAVRVKNLEVPTEGVEERRSGMVPIRGAPGGQRGERVDHRGPPVAAPPA